AHGFKKLPFAGLQTLAQRFFVWGSLTRQRYGAAPRIQFNEHQTTSISVAPWLSQDVHLLERLLNVGFFPYGPRLCMVGEVEPLKELQEPKTRQVIVERILSEYPTRTLTPDDLFYRIRVNPVVVEDRDQYDSPPSEYLGSGRLDSSDFPV